MDIAIPARQQRTQIRAIYNQRLYYLLAIPFLACVWLVSDWVQLNFVLDDPIHYRNFWFAVQQAPLAEVPFLQRDYLGAAEPLYGILIWVASTFVERPFFINVSNLVFGGTLYLLLRRYNFPVVLLPLVLVNFYFLILVGPTERLKFAAIILMVAFLRPAHRRLPYFLLLPFAHLQSLIILAPLYFSRFVPEDLRRAARANIGKILFLLLSGLVAIYLLYIGSFDVILIKLRAYSGGLGADILPALICVAIGIVYFGKRREVVLILLAMALAALVFGGSRINLMPMLMVVFLFISAGRSYHPVVLGFLAYSAFKGYQFYSNVANYGTAFPDF